MSGIDEYLGFLFTVVFLVRECTANCRCTYIFVSTKVFKEIKLHKFPMACCSVFKLKNLTWQADKPAKQVDETHHLFGCTYLHYTQSDDFTLRLTILELNCSR